MVNKFLKYSFITLVIVCSVSVVAQAQVFLGPKFGMMATTPIYRDTDLPEGINRQVKLGFNAGMGLFVPLADNLGFYSELFFSQRGRKLGGGIDDRFKYNSVNRYLELPVMVRMTFRAAVSNYAFHWYLNAGGNLSWWMSGKGSIESFEYDEANIPGNEFKNKFGTPPANTIDQDFTIYVTEPYRIRAGLEVGGGFIFDVTNGQRITLDLRYNMTQSWLGRDRNIDVGLTEYFEDYRTGSNVFSVNMVYLFSMDFNERRSRGRTTNQSK
jgi:hypothetical protein